VPDYRQRVAFGDLVRDFERFLRVIVVVVGVDLNVDAAECPDLVRRELRPRVDGLAVYAPIFIGWVVLHDGDRHHTGVLRLGCAGAIAQKPGQHDEDRNDGN
jgi:hypothetical protein